MWTETPSFESSSGFIYYTYLYLFHAGIDKAGMEQKLEKSYFRCKNTWHVESNYILQPPKYLIIVVNRFKYINNNFTKDRCSIPMDMTVVLGLHKFNLQATIDHHGPSMSASRVVCKVVQFTVKQRQLHASPPANELSWLLELKFLATPAIGSSQSRVEVNLSRQCRFVV